VTGVVGVLTSTSDEASAETTLDQSWMQTGQQFVYEIVRGTDVGEMKVTIDEVNETHVNVHFTRNGTTHEKTFIRDTREDAPDDTSYVAEFWVNGENVDQEEAWLGHKQGTLVGIILTDYQFATNEEDYYFDKDQGFLT